MADPMTAPPPERASGAPDGARLLHLYRQMLLIREFEEQVRSLFSGGAIPGLVHLCAGQEAVAVGVCAALKAGDYIASNHRGHGHCLAKGARSDRLMAELMGRRSGYCLGRSGSLHVSDPDTGNLGTNGIVGGGIPLAAGAALSAKVRGSGQVGVSFFGDGALNQGLVFEVMNMAAVWTLPAIMVCENNGYGEFTAIEDVAAGALIARGTVFDIPSETVDGMDVLAVLAAAERAVARARAGKGPTFLICNTYRYGGHHVGDKQDYKDDAERKTWEEKDPIVKLARLLTGEKHATQDDLARIAADVEKELRAAVAYAKADSAPSRDDLMRYIYAD